MHERQTTRFPDVGIFCGSPKGTVTAKSFCMVEVRSGSQLG